MDNTGTLYAIDTARVSAHPPSMARLARAVAAGVPHHVTQRGNRRQQTFFGDEDYIAYRSFLAEGCRSAGVEVWGYCMMPNHVHLILTPADPDGLRAALGEAHRRYSRRVNLREGWRGYLWQGRFASAFVKTLEQQLGRPLAPRKPGRKPKAREPA